MELENFVKQYRTISLQIKDALDNENLDSLEELLNQREEIINNQDIANCNKEELQRVYSKYEIFELDKMILEEIKLQQNELKRKMADVERGKKVTRGYNGLNTKAVFLSKEI